MAAIIIRKKDVERLGKKLLKEVYDFLHNDYILSTFEEMKKEQKKFLKNLNENNVYLDFVKNDTNITGIFSVLYDLHLDIEIDEDLYFKIKSFLDIYKVFTTGYMYLED